MAAPDETNAASPLPCPPCRGTGKVTSSLGGTQQTVDCPWCDGTGVLQREHDAQERWRAKAAQQ